MRKKCVIVPITRKFGRQGRTDELEAIKHFSFAAFAVTSKAMIWCVSQRCAIERLNGRINDSKLIDVVVAPSQWI